MPQPLPQERWMIATNGTKYASDAVSYAAKLYTLYSNKPHVVLMMVVQTEQDREDAKSILEISKYLFEDIAGKGSNLQLLLEDGEPGTAIARAADQGNMDHVFLGGSDFQWDITEGDGVPTSNIVLDRIKGTVTLVK
ncbi:MAG: universal stress protein [Bacteroidota bacterium]